MEQIVDAVPLVPLLDDPVPQIVEQLQDVMRFFDTLLPVPEQVIAAPKILLDDVPMRTAVRDTQLVEQLVEVPTIISWSSLLQRTMEQNVDIPVPGGGISGAQGFLPRQSSTAPWNTFLSGLWRRTLISPSVEASKFFSQDRLHLRRLHLQLVFMVLLVGLLKGFFALLPESSPSTLAAHVDALSGVELLAKIQQLSDQVVDMGRVAEHARKGFSLDIDKLYRLITDARIRLQQLEAWADEVAGDEDGPG